MRVKVHKLLKTFLDNIMEYQVKTDLWGNNVVTDYRPIAGGSASRSGQLFEQIVADTFDMCGLPFAKKPKFKCVYGLKREGDFLIEINNNLIQVECKQLGNAESHFDKISHCFLNMLQGCYGSHFWLIYDYNREGKKGTIRKINALKETAETFQSQARLAGISFELVDINQLQDMVSKYKYLS